MSAPTTSTGETVPVEERTEKGVRTYKFKSLVRGHYRHYHKLVKNLTEEEKRPHVLSKVDGEDALILKFIQPFWRGPDYADVVNRQCRTGV